MSIGQKIKQVRISRGITQQDLADQAKINLRTIQRIENDEVIPRSYTLKTIAQILEIEESELFDSEAMKNERPQSVSSKLKLAGLHFSALIFVPTLLIWFFEKEHDQDINFHGADIINFQLTMLAILLPCILLPGLPQLIALFTLIVIVVNTVRVLKGKSYYYPLTIRIMKK